MLFLFFLFLLYIIEKNRLSTPLLTEKLKVNSGLKGVLGKIKEIFMRSTVNALLKTGNYFTL